MVILLVLHPGHQETYRGAPAHITRSRKLFLSSVFNYRRGESPLNAMLCGSPLTYVPTKTTEQMLSNMYSPGTTAAKLLHPPPRGGRVGGEPNGYAAYLRPRGPSAEPSNDRCCLPLGAFGVLHHSWLRLSDSNSIWNLNSNLRLVEFQIPA